MEDQNICNKLHKLFHLLQLGKITAEPLPVSGGLLHKMYCVETSLGKYAVKALNPQIMSRPTAMQNYWRAESIAMLVSQRVPALAAKRINGHFMHEIDGQYFLIFDWMDGTSLRTEDIHVSHCVTIGKLLADIHNTDFSKLGLICQDSKAKKEIDWRFYLIKGKTVDAPWVEPLSAVIDMLYIWQEQALAAEQTLASNQVISHRDLDCKNVLWKGESPTIIDWESAGFINPLRDLMETALYWSEDVQGSIDQKRFMAFLQAYKDDHHKLDADWSVVLASGFSSKLGWLEYSLKRSIGLECNDSKEQQLGTSQAIETISAILSYAEHTSEIVHWLSNI